MALEPAALSGFKESGNRQAQEKLKPVAGICRHWALAVNSIAKHMFPDTLANKPVCAV